MKKRFTLNLFAGSKKSTILALTAILFVTSVLFIGCYKYRSIKQPTDGYTNSWFDVPIVAQRDDDPTLGDPEWSNVLRNFGLFGIMIPNGWTVHDSIAYTIISKDPSLNNSGYLIFNLGNTKTLQDSIPAIPGYHWWGAKTDRIAELTQLDSMYYTPRIKTNGLTGAFYLRYAMGDVDYWDRNPADRYNYGGGLSDPIQINITSNVGVAELLSKANVSVYPNPTEGMLHVNLHGYKSEVITMNVINSTGQLVKTYEIMKGTNEFNLSSLPKGMYVIELINGTSKSSSKILLQ